MKDKLDSGGLLRNLADGAHVFDPVDWDINAGEKVYFFVLSPDAISRTYSKFRRF